MLNEHTRYLYIMETNVRELVMTVYSSVTSIH
jgi:hypothetical protein